MKTDEKVKTKEKDRTAGTTNSYQQQSSMSNQTIFDRILQRCERFIRDTYSILVAGLFVGTSLIYILTEYRLLDGIMIESIPASLIAIFGIIPFVCGFLSEVLPSTDRLTAISKGSLAGWLSNSVVTLVLIYLFSLGLTFDILNDPMDYFLLFSVILSPILLGAVGGQTAKWIRKKHNITNN